MSGITQDGAQKTSSMRVMMIVTVCTGCLVAILGIVLGRGAETAALVGALLLPAFGGKALQSRAGQ